MGAPAAKRDRAAIVAFFRGIDGREKPSYVFWHQQASAPGAARDVHGEGSAQEGGPIHAGKARVKAVIDSAMPERATIATTRADEAR